jgi:hypothetical protein
MEVRASAAPHSFRNEYRDCPLFMMWSTSSFRVVV